MPNFNKAIANQDQPLEGDALESIIQQSIADEYEAKARYRQIANACEDERVKKVFLSVANEELVHVGEFRSLLKSLFADSVAEEAKGEQEGVDLLKEDEEEVDPDEDETPEDKKPKMKLMRVIQK